MSPPRSRFPLTLAELRNNCPLLDSIEVIGEKHTEELIGKRGGAIVVRARGKITPRLIADFRNSYQKAVHFYLIQPRKGAP